MLGKYQCMNISTELYGDRKAIDSTLSGNPLIDCFLDVAEDLGQIWNNMFPMAIYGTCIWRNESHIQVIKTVIDNNLGHPNGV